MESRRNQRSKCRRTPIAQVGIRAYALWSSRLFSCNSNQELRELGAIDVHGYRARRRQGQVKACSVQPLVRRVARRSAKTNTAPPCTRSCSQRSRAVCASRSKPRRPRTSTPPASSSAAPKSTAPALSTGEFHRSPPRSSPVNAVRWRNSRIPALLDDHQRHRGLGGCCSLGANAKAPSFAFDALTHRTLRTETEPWYFGPSPHLRQCPNHRWVRERTAWDALPVRAHRRTPRSLDTCRR